MPSVEGDITVDAPIDRVYQAWTDYERFPSFMENVKEVRRTGADLTHWVVDAAGQRVEWDATTTQEDRRRVAWRARGESGQSGEVRFEPVGDNKTKLKVTIDYNLPSGLQEAAANVLRIDHHVLKEDLKNFKSMIEERGGSVP